MYDTRRSLSEAMSDIQDLIVTIYYIGEDGQKHPLNIDHFAKESNDYFFFRRVMLKLLELDEFKKTGPGKDRPSWIEFWSDGGPKHFKIRRSLFLICVEMKERLTWNPTVTWAFFASHHGKSVNDAHAAVVKRKIWRLAREGERTERPKQLAEMCKTIKNTSAFYFDFFVKENQFKVSAIPGIKLSHCFKWSGKKTQKGQEELYELNCYRQYPEKWSRKVVRRR